MQGKLFLTTLALCVAYATANSTTICQNQPQGSLHANPNDCSQYYRCENQSGILLQCKEDHLWKDENKWCDFPFNVKCGGRPNPHPPPTSVCSGLDEVHVPDYNDCSKYYLCANGYPIHKKCEGDYLWNDVMKWCDFPNNVQCAKPPTNGTTTTTSATITTTTAATNTTHLPTTESPHNNGTTVSTLPTPTTATPSPTICKEEGQLIPNPEDCGSFFQCHDGRPLKQMCPAGLHFNPVSHICDYPANAGCQFKTLS